MLFPKLCVHVQGYGETTFEMKVVFSSLPKSMFLLPHVAHLEAGLSGSPSSPGAQ